MFAEFKEKVLIEGTLRCTTAMRVGVGRTSLDAAGTDLPILRSAAGAPLLPGSSLKGVMRSALEALLRGAVPESRWRELACDRAIAPCVLDKLPKEDEHEDAATQAKRLRDRLQKRLCCICRTFGAPGLASHVVFRDAVASHDTLVERRDGVGIDRDLGRVSGARKYDFEVVPAGTEFKLVIALDSADPWQVGLVVVGVELLSQGMLRIGGMSSRGLGEVEVVEQTLAARVLTRDAALQGAAPETRDWGKFSEQARGAWGTCWRRIQAGEGVAAC